MRGSTSVSLPGCFALLVIAIVLGGIVFVVVSALWPSTTTTFVNLPMPAITKYQTNVSVQTVGDVAQVRVGSPLMSVDFSSTGDGAGANETQEVCIKQQCATTIEYNWGNFYTNGILSSVTGYNPQGELVEARITLKYEDASFLRIFACGAGCTVDLSRLVLLYLPDEEGWPRLQQAIYVEEYGFASNTAVVATGPGAVWNDAAKIFPQYAHWGFWETETQPVQAVKAALEAARVELEVAIPTYKIVDEDGPSEVIDRQTGMRMYVRGKHAGDINFTYCNNWGRMPNTPFIGSGALCRLEWVMTDGAYYALSVMSSKLDPRPTSFYVFSEDKRTAEAVEATPVTQLYGTIREGGLPGVFLAIYSAGGVGKISDTVSGGDTLDTVDIGEGGGVFYSVVGDPSLDDVQLAHGLLSLMGRGGIVATRFFYATQPDRGNGLLYYTAALTLMQADDELALAEYGFDGGLLDRVGFPPLDAFFPSTSAAMRD